MRLGPLRLFWNPDRIFGDPSGWALCGVLVRGWFTLDYTPRRRLLSGQRPWVLLWVHGRYARSWSWGRPAPWEPEWS
jgi:hypothetical protein